MRTLIMLVIAALFAQAAHAQNVFTYQGELKDNGNPVNATKTLRFVLFDDESNPTPVESLGEHEVDIVDGLFSIELNQTVALGADLYLEVTVVDATEHVLSPRQRITFAPKSLYSLTTRGIHVGPSGLVGINTTNPGASLEVRGGFGQTEMFRISTPESTSELRFYVDSLASSIQSFETDVTRVGQLNLNPFGGKVIFGGDIEAGQIEVLGIRFSDNSTFNSVPTQNLLGFVGEATHVISNSIEIAGGGSIGFGTAVPGAMPGDIVIAYTANPLNDQFILHNARVTNTGTVGVTITNANTDAEAFITDTLDPNTIHFKVLRH